jgi:predicted GIY-YIG superfamily endonuclease
MKTVYLLQSLPHPEQYYVGLAEHVEDRLQVHNRGESLHTAKYRPWKLIVAVQFVEDRKAHAFELYLKTGSGRAFAKRHFR